MKNKVKALINSQRGINTVEIVIILAVVVGIALIFREQIGGFVNGLMVSIFQNTNADYSVEGVRNITASAVSGH